MNTNFNMSIESTTRRKPWRVVWVLITLTLITLSVFVLYRLWLTRNMTSSFRPEGTLVTVRVIKTADNISAIEDSLGNNTLIAGAPWTINDAFSWAKREISFHFDDSGIIAVTVDRPLPNSIIKNSLNYDLYSGSNGNNGYLGFNEYDVVRTKPINPQLLLPYFDGEFIQYSTNFARYPIELRPGQVKIKGIHRDNAFQSEVLFSENSDVLAKMWVQGTDIMLPRVFKAAFENSIQSQLLDEIQKNGAYVAFSRDNAGLAINLIFQSEYLSLEQLAMLGKEIINRNTMSTVAWTIEDGTVLNEIRAQVEEINSDISSNDLSNQITLSNSRGDMVRITKNGDMISISNREIVLNLDNSTPPLVCNRRADNFIKPRELIKILSDSDDQNSNQNIVTKFSGIVFAKNSIIICW